MAPPPSEADVQPPRLRVVEAVQRRRIRAGDVLHAQLEMRHPNRTGLALSGGEYVQRSEPFHLEWMEATYAGERVCAFEMTPALSDDPFITFALLARRDAPLEVNLVNSRGERFRASHPILIQTSQGRAMPRDTPAAAEMVGTRTASAPSSERPNEDGARRETALYGARI